jgi:hypothetical protein
MAVISFTMSSVLEKFENLFTCSGKEYYNYRAIVNCGFSKDKTLILWKMFDVRRRGKKESVNGVRRI